MSEEKIGRIVKSVLGKSDSQLTDFLLRAVHKDYDKKRLKERLYDYVSESSKVSKIIEKLYDDVLANERKRTYNDSRNDQNGDSKRSRLETQSAKIYSAPDKTKNASTDRKDEKSEGKVKSIHDVMDDARRLIEQRKKDMHMTNPTGHGKLGPDEASHFLRQTMDKQSKVDELRARISERLNMVMAVHPAGKQSGKPTPLLLDREGKAIDGAGHEMLIAHRTPTLKANIRAEKREHMKKTMEVVQQEQQRPEIDQIKSEFFDPRVGAKATVRKRRQFKFHDKGIFEKMARQMRVKAKLSQMESNIAQRAKQTGISAVVKLAVIAPKPELENEYIPNMEWWDQIILNIDNYDVNLDDLDHSVITNLIEHPVELQPPGTSNEPEALNVFLTKKERKKLRRQNRKETQREKTEKIRLGLEPPPDPKVKISNLMRVLGQQAIQDPTKMEAYVRNQMAKRLRKHEEANKARKLTPEQRSLKKAKKLQEDVSKGVYVSVFRVLDLSHPAKKFKVEMNAKQLYLTGTILIHKDVNVVVVEGGPKQQKFYKQLMLHRIKWKEDDGRMRKDAVESNVEKPPNRCSLVWEGIVKERNFGEIRIRQCPLEKQAREHFQKHGVEHYWDMAYSGAILEIDEDES